MCGIAGATRGLLGDSPVSILQCMSEVMKHRGPDDKGMFWNEEVGFVHRRLSILDLSDKGRQPMISPDGQIVLVFNGEIYNYPKLKNILEAKGYFFRTSTDTEVILCLYQEEGINCLEHLRGMFAFAIWDERYRRLFLARDRIGKKPLFYHVRGRDLAFASEIKSILELPSISRRIESTAVVDYLKHQYIPNPKTIYQGIFKLPPAHYLIFDREGLSIRQYWDLDFSSPLEENGETLADQLLAILRDSISCRLLSDVPLGAFLSGGIDSSAVVALMAKLQNDSVNTCTVGFKNPEYDEAGMAAETAEYFHTRHHEFFVEPELTDILDRLAWHFDEPFADDSAVPTYYVSKLARQVVTVALSGDGGDENFAGYEKYYKDSLENQIRHFIPPRVARALLEPIALLSSFGGMTFKKAKSLFENLSITPDRAYYNTNSFATDHALRSVLSESLCRNVRDYDPFENMKKYFDRVDAPDHLSRLLYVDFKTYLTDDILVKVDRMSMANSLEIRCPFLDQELVSFAARIPSHLKISGCNQKAILRKCLDEILPPFVFGRKKHGFDLPKSIWLRGKFRKQTEQYILGEKYMADFFDVKNVATYWSSYQDGDEQHVSLLWSLLNFSIWFRRFMLSKP